MKEADFLDWLRMAAKEVSPGGEISGGAALLAVFLKDELPWYSAIELNATALKNKTVRKIVLDELLHDHPALQEEHSK